MATIKEIAQKVGTSPSTVSIVLGGRGPQRKISQEMQDRVLEAARALGYQPSLEARRLRAIQEDAVGGDYLTLAVFWPAPLRETLLVRYLQGSQLPLGEDPQKLVQNIYFYTSGQLCRQAALFTGSHFHAAVVYGASGEDLAFLESRHFPVPIVLNSSAIFSTVSRYSMVRNDLSYTAQLILQAFASNGGARIALCQSGPNWQPNIFSQYAQPLGMEVLSTESYCVGSIEGGSQWVLQQAECHGGRLPFDCLYCGSERIALGALRALKTLGVSVPGEMRIIAVDVYNLNIEEVSTPALSTINIPAEEAALETIHLVRYLLKNPAAPAVCRTVRAHYMARGTCGPVRL